MNNNKNAREALKYLPSVDDLLREYTTKSNIDNFIPLNLIKTTIRDSLDHIREEIKANNSKIDTVRDELKTDIKETNSKIDTGIQKLDSKIDEVRKDINANTWKLLTGLVVIMGVFSFLTQALS